MFGHEGRHRPVVMGRAMRDQVNNVVAQHHVGRDLGTQRQRAPVAFRQHIADQPGDAVLRQVVEGIEFVRRGLPTKQCAWQLRAHEQGLFDLFGRSRCHRRRHPNGWALRPRQQGRALGVGDPGSGPHGQSQQALGARVGLQHRGHGVQTGEPLQQIRSHRLRHRPDARNGVVGRPRTAPEQSGLRRRARKECIERPELAKPCQHQRPPEQGSLVLRRQRHVVAGDHVLDRHRRQRFEVPDVSAARLSQQRQDARTITGRVQGSGNHVAIGLAGVVGHAAQMLAQRTQGNTHGQRQRLAPHRRARRCLLDDLPVRLGDTLPCLLAERKTRGRVQRANAHHDIRVTGRDCQQRSQGVGVELRGHVYFCQACALRFTFWLGAVRAQKHGCGPRPGHRHVAPVLLFVPH